MSFADLGLSEELLRAVADSGYNDPTPIQRQAIPPVLMGRDIIGVAQTGTGKTASFVLPMIDILAEGRSRARMPRSLILEPTRELAQQVSENFDKYGKYHKLSMALLIGGVSMGDQLAALEKGVDVLIATPGRLMDLFGRGKIMLNQCSLLVIDEADRMLDMGFIPDIEEICTKLPSPRQTLLFSATMPPPIKKLADRFMDSPRLIEVARPASTNVSITQYVVETTARGKRETLRTLLADPEVRNAIIFCNRKRDIKELVDSLRRSGMAVSQIHGDMDQSDRIKELDRFKSGDINIIVASDVAARGLDIPGVSHVVNYDVPHHAEDYVHRIGRTGRAGRTGIAYTLATEAEADNLAEVEKLIRQKIQRYGGPPAAEAPGTVVEIAVPVVAAPEADIVETATPAEATDAPKRRRRGGRGRKRESDANGTAAESAAPAPVAPPRAAEPARPSRAPAPRVEAPRVDTRTPRAPVADPIRAYRGSREIPRREDRRNQDDGETVIGFGPEGIPDFLTRKATMR
ncbi:DEAD/DEAH box helicase [Polymorphobacter fuscus]|uniref:DEAD-box ATP-dependent RNA helicase RhpA n=1 Tax=Sandarakinorhabdus fusca TaxID=1439888 RepID=A0A7C9KXM6_9SPHN|nr:DEAD/DEAH box helicase [Polymorphobacter fuscus]KAB7646390.1 DEAD/DEAH box helicase [Polymorphobacter fuscus]MQT17622.1 DEAD/DEAH box helicase [Polymorphobacter fuscus]NJC09835.1 superfamily II DNA/RNA helicase [Polymorphobacter fuscus]